MKFLVKNLLFYHAPLNLCPTFELVFYNTENLLKNVSFFPWPSGYNDSLPCGGQVTLPLVTE